MTCAGKPYTVRIYPDGTAAVVDGNGITLADWTMTAALTASVVRTKSEEELCAELLRLDVRQ